MPTESTIKTTMKPRTVRLLWVLAVLVAVGATVYGVLRVFNDNLVFFYTPTQMMAGEVPAGRSYRLGGMVEQGSLKREAGTTNIAFRVTDMAHTVPVRFSGITPDLFKEGKGVIAEGSMKDGVFISTEILAKHDENYAPPALKK
jgi:cytochrome c-type biogenesis protein CcmE